MNRCVAFVFSTLLFFPTVSRTQNTAWRPFIVNYFNTVGINPLNPNSVYAHSAQLIVSYDRGLTWSALGSVPIGSARQILVHPADTTVIFMVDFSSGLHRSSDYGATWTNVLPGVGIDGESLCIDPLHPDTLYMGNYADGAVHRSIDRGLTWEFRSFAGPFLCALSVRPDSSDILYAGTGSGTISKTTDGGLTWRQVKEGGSFEIPKIVINPVNPMISYGTGYEGTVSARGAWKTTDGGEEWFLTSLADTSLWAMDIDASNPETVYGGLFSAGSGVFRTTNGGSSWEILASGLPPAFDAWSIKVHPLDPSLVWLAGGGGIYRLLEPLSTIQGWVVDAGTGDTVRNGILELASTGEIVLLDTSGGYFSVNYYEGDPSLTTTIHVESYPYYLKDVEIEFQIGMTRTLSISLTELPAASISGVIRDSLSLDPLHAEVSLTATTTLGDQIFTSLTDPDGNYAIDDLYITYEPIISYGTMAITPDFPHSKEVLGPVILDSTGLTLDVQIDTADVLVTSSVGSGDYFDYYRKPLAVLGLGSHYWDQESSGTLPVSAIRDVRKDILVYFTGDDADPLPQAEIDSLENILDSGIPVFITGQNFVEANGSFALVADRLGLMQTGNTTALISKGNDDDLFDGFLFFTSGGTGAGNQTSQDILQIIGSSPVDVIRYGTLGTIGTAAVRIEDAGGGSRLILFGFGFEGISLDLTAQNAMAQIIGYLDGSITVSVEEEGGELPTQFSLEQNYPNPFNPKSAIEMRIAEPSDVTLKIFDLLGREVATLVDERLAPGIYTRTWDATGRPSGVYFYRLSTDSFVQTKKLVLLR